MRIPRVIRWLLVGTAEVLLILVLCVATVWAYFHPSYTRIAGIVYGQRQGHDLTIEMVRPARPNGLGVLLLNSGGWKSQAGSFKPWIASAVLRRGYTLFVVNHVSQPEATVMETVEDVNRAVRFVRHNAGRYGVDPNRLGVTGGSAGGHLSLMLATRGGSGPVGVTDSVDSESSAVQAVAIFFSVTDLLNLGDSTENLHDNGPPKSFVQAFGTQSTNPPVWQVIGREMSPIFFITSNLPPTLIYHGDADTLVPLDQSLRFQQAAHKLGRTVEVVVHHGGIHGWLSMVLDLRRFADWFDIYLRGRN